MKLLLSLVLCLSMAPTFGQSTSTSNLAGKGSNLFFDLAAGTRLGGINSGANASGMHVNGGLGYMINPVVGIKGDVGYNYFGSTTGSMRTSLQGVLSISNWANFVDYFDLDFHAGFGWSTMWNKNFNLARPDFDDGKIIGKNDDMGNIIFGLTPIINFPYQNSNQTLSLTADFSYVMLLSNDNSFDWVKTMDKSMSGYFNLSLGIKIRVGTGK